jgi:hypothetical protein
VPALLKNDNLTRVTILPLFRSRSGRSQTPRGLKARLLASPPLSPGGYECVGRGQRFIRPSWLFCTSRCLRLSAVSTHRNLLACTLKRVQTLMRDHLPHQWPAPDGFVSIGRGKRFIRPSWPFLNIQVFEIDSFLKCQEPPGLCSHTCTDFDARPPASPMASP